MARTASEILALELAQAAHSRAQIQAAYEQLQEEHQRLQKTTTTQGEAEAAATEE